MEENIIIKGYYKSTDPEKIIVYRAESLEKEIRFYFNEEQYVAARDNENGRLTVEYNEIKHTETVKDNKSMLEIIKENSKDFLKFICLLSISVFLISVLIFSVAMYVKNVMIKVLIINFIWLSFYMIICMILVLRSTPSSLRSKHSAEHMMVNFIQLHKRLPKNMKEIKKSSRFINTCSSINLVEKIANYFTYITVVLILSIIILQCLSQYLERGILLGVIWIVIYITVAFAVENLLCRYQRLDFMTKSLQKVLCNIIQCCNTTKKVEDSDIKLAYYAAKYWMKEVYPEFYTEDGNIFYECEKVSN